MMSQYQMQHQDYPSARKKRPNYQAQSQIPQYPQHNHADPPYIHHSQPNHSHRHAHYGHSNMNHKAQHSGDFNANSNPNFNGNHNGNHSGNQSGNRHHPTSAAAAPHYMKQNGKPPLRTTHSISTSGRSYRSSSEEDPLDTDNDEEVVHIKHSSSKSKTAPYIVNHHHSSQPPPHEHRNGSYRPHGKGHKNEVCSFHSFDI